MKKLFLALFFVFFAIASNLSAGDNSPPINNNADVSIEGSVVNVKADMKKSAVDGLNVVQSKVLNTEQALSNDLDNTNGILMSNNGISKEPAGVSNNYNNSEDNDADRMNNEPLVTVTKGELNNSLDIVNENNSEKTGEEEGTYSNVDVVIKGPIYNVNTDKILYASLIKVNNAGVCSGGAANAAGIVNNSVAFLNLNLLNAQTEENSALNTDVNQENLTI